MLPSLLRPADLALRGASRADALLPFRLAPVGVGRSATLVRRDALAAGGAAAGAAGAGASVRSFTAAGAVGVLVPSSRLMVRDIRSAF